VTVDVFELIPHRVEGALRAGAGMVWSRKADALDHSVDESAVGESMLVAGDGRTVSPPPQQNAERRRETAPFSADETCWRTGRRSSRRQVAVRPPKDRTMACPLRLELRLRSKGVRHARIDHASQGAHLIRQRVAVIGHPITYAPKDPRRALCVASDQGDASRAEMIDDRHGLESTTHGHGLTEVRRG
jgi:hypothetical protein